MAIQLQSSGAIDLGLLNEISATVHRQANPALMNAIRKNGIHAVAGDPQSVVDMQFTFSHEIRTGDITNQKNSGRCWMFAGLNTFRVRVATLCNLETFELSQAYPMFWDKFEKANYFLESILETLDEPADGRLVAWLLKEPLQDGGQWDMFVNVVKKYGVVPKAVMPEAYHSSRSRDMNDLLTVKLREDAARLRDQHRAHGASLAMLRQQKTDMLQDIYQMLCAFLGEPPSRFDFEYRDKDDQFHRDSGLTPQLFFERYVDIELDDYVSVINAPTADKPFGKTYTVQYLGNVKGGQDVLYLNVPIDELRDLAVKQLLDNAPVWFGCDVGKHEDRENGILDTGAYDYEGALGVKFALSKAERLDYGESEMTHAMVFTGVNVVDGAPNRWKVENSWGAEAGNKGFFVMSDDWFAEYMYQIVVNKKYLTAEHLQALDQAPVVLAPWDPMGSLARMM